MHKARSNTIYYMTHVAIDIYDVDNIQSTGNIRQGTTNAFAKETYSALCHNRLGHSHSPTMCIGLVIIRTHFACMRGLVYI